MRHRDATGSNLSHWIARGLLLLALVLAIIIRVRLVSMPLERDEGEFGYLGQLILRGIPPYRMACTMKLPGTFLAYAGIMAAFGETATGIHLGIIVVNLTTILLIYCLASRLVDPFAGGIGALAFSVMSVSPDVAGMAGHATHFVAFFGTAGALSLLIHFQSNTKTWLLASGLLFGIAFVMKQHGIFFSIFGIVAIVCYEGFRAERVPLRLLVSSLLMGIGVVLPYGAVCLWLLKAGVWKEFVFWTLTYASQYTQMVDRQHAIQLLKFGLIGVTTSSWTLWILASIGTVYMAFDRDLRRVGRWYAFGLLVASMACVVPGMLFRPHYFIAMLPAVAIFAGAGASALIRFASPSLSRQESNQTTIPIAGFKQIDLRPLVGSVLAGLIAFPIGIQAQDFFRTPPIQLCQKIYYPNPFAESPAIAKYLREHTIRSDNIAIFGSEPQLLFESRRDTCTQFIYVYGLVEPQPLARQMQEEMIEQVERAEPKYIVTVNVHFSWLVSNRETLIFDWIADYLKTEYHLVGMVNLFPDHTDMRWDNELVANFPQSPSNVQVYRRN